MCTSELLGNKMLGKGKWKGMSQKVQFKICCGYVFVCVVMCSMCYVVYVYMLCVVMILKLMV